MFAMACQDMLCLLAGLALSCLRMRVHAPMWGMHYGSLLGGNHSNHTVEVLDTLSLWFEKNNINCASICACAFIFSTEETPHLSREVHTTYFSSPQKEVIH